MPYKNGDRELLVMECRTETRIIEITFVDVKDDGRHKAVSGKFEFTRIPPAGDSMSGYVTYRGAGETWTALERQRGITKKPSWLDKYTYYGYCSHHESFYRKDSPMGCYNCYREEQARKPEAIATSWD